MESEQVGFLRGLLDDSRNKARQLGPAPYVSCEATANDREAYELGQQMLRQGHIGLVTVAGGQGSRLGFEGPKGAFPISPIRKAPLFQIFAEKIRAASLYYGAALPWYIMTSHDNHEETVDLFRGSSFYGLDPERVWFFRQDRIPSLYPGGRLVLGEHGGIFRNPNGHGCSRYRGDFLFSGGQSTGS